jgi:predicted nucleotide-binding protein
VAISQRTIAALAAPFEGGGGPSHSTIELVWTSADASEYLPSEGNKLNRVLGGLHALRDGRRKAPGIRALPPHTTKLQLVASELATRLVATGAVKPADVQEALEGRPARAPQRKRSRKPITEAAKPSRRTAAPAGAPGPSQAADALVPDPRVVMVVHGQDNAARKAMFDWLRAIGLKPREWSQAVKATGEASPFIGDVVEAAFAEAQAVVVLFTPDEHVTLRKELRSGAGKWRLQARPNVLFEAGIAFASDPRRTIIVVLGEQDLPSDLAGRHYVRLGNAQALQNLAQRLRDAGCPVDDSGDDWLDVDRFPPRSGIKPAPR